MCVMTKKIILTGIRPTGNLHLGHLFGAAVNWQKLQESGNEFFLEIADVQALTDNFNDPNKVCRRKHYLVMMVKVLLMVL